MSLQEELAELEQEIASLQEETGPLQEKYDQLFREVSVFEAENKHKKTCPACASEKNVASSQ